MVQISDIGGGIPQGDTWANFLTWYKFFYPKAPPPVYGDPAVMAQYEIYQKSQGAPPATQVHPPVPPPTSTPPPPAYAPLPAGTAGDGGGGGAGGTEGGGVITPKGTVVGVLPTGSYLYLMPDGTYADDEGNVVDPVYAKSITGGGATKPAYKPKPTETPSPGYEWWWNEGGGYWEEKPTAAIPPTPQKPLKPKPKETPSPGYQWEWNEEYGEWVEEPTGKAPSVTPKPFPTETPPKGYHWELNETTGEWYPAVGATDTGDMTEYQRRSLELERERMKSDWVASARNAAIQWMQTLAQLKARPGNWIHAWMFEHGFSDDSKQLLDILKPPAWLFETPEIPQTHQGQPGEAGQDADIHLGEQGEKVGSWIPQLGGPATPPAPGWLPTYFPGLKAGKPITPQGSVLPSAQMWGKTPWSKREMVGGMLDYSIGKGRYPSLPDLEEEIVANIPRKVSQSSWRPVLQR